MRAIALKVCEHLVEKLLGQLENVCQTFLDRHWPEENHYEGDPDLIRRMLSSPSFTEKFQPKLSLYFNVRKKYVEGHSATSYVSIVVF